MTKKALNNHQEVYVVKMYERNYSASDVAKKFNVSKTTIRRILKKRKARIRPLSEAIKLSFQKYPNRNHIIKEIEVPQTEEELCNEAEIIGMIIGDGCISKNYSIYFKVGEKDFAKNFLKLIQKTYGLSSIIRYRDNCYVCDIHSKKLATRINKYTKNNQKIPEHIINGSKEMKARFIRGFIDAEGSMDVIYNRRQIVITQKDTMILKGIQKILIDLGIQSTIIKKKFDCDKLIISLLDNLEKYGRLIGFSIKEKQEKLDKAIKYLIRCKSHEKEKYWEVLRHWLKSKKSLRSSAKELRLNWETYRTWIYGMKMPCQIKKDIEFGWVPEDYTNLKEQYEFLPNVNPLS